MKHLSLAHKKRGFNMHAFSFVLTIIVLLAVNLWTGAPYWIVWVLLGGGIGLLAHWWFVLGPGALQAETD